MQKASFGAAQLYKSIFLIAPLLAQFVFCVALFIDHEIICLDWEANFYLPATVIAIAPFAYFQSKKVKVKNRVWKIWLALYLAIIISLTNLIGAYVGKLEINNSNFPLDGFLLAWAFIQNASFLITGLYFGLSSVSTIGWFYFIFATYIAYVAGFAFGLYRRKIVVTDKKALYLLTLIVVILSTILAGLIVYKKTYTISEQTQAMESIAEYENRSGYSRLFALNSETNMTKTLRGAPTTYFENDLPSLDSATAFCPIYVSAVQALYKKTEKNSYYHDYCAGSPIAYDSLINGEVDLIFALAPSSNQLQRASDNNVTLSLTPIGKEAFVFLVNEHNPIKSLTIEQIQKIYTGEITNWREVGGANEKILAFQRNENSGSQTTMENGVMKGLKLKTALLETVQSMGGLIDVVADYRNAENAIGYSFRFFVTDMMKAQGVRLLAINGVEPTPENIQNGSYPLIMEFYIIARKNDISENSQKLIDWFLSEQGQALIEDVGYIPIKKANNDSARTFKYVRSNKSV